MKHVSFSQFSVFTNCQLQWKLLYIDRHKVKDVNIHSLFGSALNDTLQTYLIDFYEKSEKTANELNLNEILLNKMSEIFNQYSEYGDFTSKDQMMEFYKDGIKILEWFKKKRSDYFLKKGYEFLGCEIEISIPIKSNINFIGRIDCAVKHIDSNTYVLYDFKKSYRGWKENAKKDLMKRAQLQLYKKFYAEQNNIDLDKIKVEFLIFKQKIFKSQDYEVKRVQRFVPPSGDRIINKVGKELIDFVDNVFDSNGNYNLNFDYKANPSKRNCFYCPFKNKKDLCSVGMNEI